MAAPAVVGAVAPAEGSLPKKATSATEKRLGMNGIWEQHMEVLEEWQPRFPQAAEEDVLWKESRIAVRRTTRALRAVVCGVVLSMIGVSSCTGRGVSVVLLHHS